jgi:hypothetical protein
MASFSEKITTTLPFVLSTTTMTTLSQTSSSNISVNQLSDQDKIFILNTKLIVYGWMMLPLAIIGLLLNGFTILVLLHPRMRNFSTNAYLTALSIANIICLINFIFLYSLRYILSNSIFHKNIDEPNANLVHPYESFINFILRYWSPIFTMFQLFAIYLTCAITVDRFIYLALPLKVDSICTIKNTLRTILIIFVFCVLYNLPKFFEVEHELMNSSKTNQTYYQAKSTELGKNPIYNQIINRYCYLIFVYGVPFLILLIVNIGIVFKLVETKKRKNNLLGISKANNDHAGAKSNETLNSNGASNAIVNNASSPSSDKSTRKKQQHHGHKSSHIKFDPKITLMVLAVVSAFFCCQFPYLIMWLLPSSYHLNVWYYIGKTICDFLLTFNCCINFLIYCVFGQNFRSIATQLLCHPSLKPYNRAILRNNTYNTTKTKSLKSLPASVNMNNLDKDDSREEMKKRMKLINAK